MSVIFRDIEETARTRKPSYFRDVEIRTTSGKISVPYFSNIACYAIGLGCGDDGMARIFCLGRVYGSETRNGTPVTAVMLGEEGRYRAVLQSELKHLDKNGRGVQLPLAKGCDCEIVFVDKNDIIKLPVTPEHIPQQIAFSTNTHNLNGARQLGLELF